MTMQLSIPSGGWDGPVPWPAKSALAAADGWLQELETQAHALSWFQGALGCRSCVAGATPTPATGQGPTRVEAASAALSSSALATALALDLLPTVQDATRAGSGSGLSPARTGAAPIAAGTAAGEPASSWPAPTADAARGAARRAVSIAASPAPASSQRPSESAPPVRVHVEQGASGLLVWIGVDGDAASAAARFAAILAQLRGAAALPLAALVCNGTLVYAAAAPRNPFDPDQEASWR
jgi:hypothetical protein